jgi:hypothetical protein
LVLRSALLARRASADHGPASLGAGPHFGDRIAIREHVRGPSEIATVRRVVRPPAGGGPRVESLGREMIGAFYIPG